MYTLKLENLVGNWIQNSENILIIEKFSPTNMTILITGETGVGKGALANLILKRSNRKEKKFIDVNCGALSESLLESVLFGHCKGSFTSAVSDHVGLFEEAKGGTIFLDEITETSLNFQTNLLKVLENKTIRRVGGQKDIPIDVRVIVASNKNIIEAVENKNFRRDLYYRLNMVDIYIPPLRERFSDISIIANHFLKIFNIEQKKSIHHIHPETIAILTAHPWFGNVRELRNVIEYTVTLEESESLLPQNLPMYFFKSRNLKTPFDENKFQDGKIPSITTNFELPYKKMISSITEQYIIDLIRKTRGNITKMSNLSELDRKTIYKKLNELNININNFRE